MLPWHPHPVSHHTLRFSLMTILESALSSPFSPSLVQVVQPGCQQAASAQVAQDRNRFYELVLSWKQTGLYLAKHGGGNVWLWHLALGQPFPRGEKADVAPGHTAPHWGNSESSARRGLPPSRRQRARMSDRP